MRDGALAKAAIHNDRSRGGLVSACSRWLIRFGFQTETLPSFDEVVHIPPLPFRSASPLAIGRKCQGAYTLYVGPRRPGSEPLCV